MEKTTKLSDYALRIVHDALKRLLFLVLALLPLASWAQMVRGTVSDQSGEPLIGVSVIVKGTATGVTTDLDGTYAIAARNGQTLVFSYVGMTTQEVKVSGTKLDIVMQDNALNLDDVVVVGYGKQKKSSITGAVSAIKGDELLVTPATNITQILGGRIAGISSVQTSGEPGQDQAALRIRGSINDVTYIVDGIPRGINEVDPNDIESVSVLKDASATAVYGLKSSGGVIIVTTKKGSKQSPTITYDGQIGGSYNANFPKFMNAKEFMNYYNMADLMDQLARGVITDRSQYVPRYPQSMIDQVSTGQLVGEGYDDVSYIDKVFGTGTNTKHTLSMQGGNDRATYYGSIGYMGQDGNIDNFTYDRYSMRLNLESKIGKYWTLSMGASGFVADTKTPGFYSGGADNGYYEVGYLSIAHQAIAMHPYLAERYNGLYTGIISANGSSPNSPLAAIYESGYKKTHAISISTNVALRFDVPWVEGLSAKFTGAYDYSNSRNKNLDEPFDVANYNASARTFTTTVGAKGTSIRVGQGMNNYSQLLADLQLNYDRTFGDHTLGLLALMEVRDNKSDGMSAYAKDLNFTGLPELNYGTMDAIGGWSDHSRVAGFVFRGQYNYADKYYAEFSGRYDGSYKFSGNVSGKRWSFFPSASVAWRISKENFMESTRDWLSDLKLRVSYGVTGDDSGSDAYAFLSTYAFGNKVATNEALVNSVYLAYIANPDLTWQKTNSLNYGFDASFWGGKLGLEVDAFYNYTHDMLMSMGGDYPASMGGYYKTYANYGKMDAKGIDVLVSHRNRLTVGGKPFNYGITANVSWAKNRWLRYPDAPNTPEWAKVTGTSVNAFYGWVADGLYRSEEEIDNSAWFGTRPNVGDIRYVDLNGDGKIDYQDRGRIGRDSRPEVTFGLGLSADWNGFDLNAQFTGGAKFDVSMTGTYYNGYDDNTIWTQTFKEQGNSPLFLVTNAWNIDNPDGTMPRLTAGNTGHGSDNGLASTFWFRKGDYLRLKSLQIGYTIPRALTMKIGIEKIRLYAQGCNLFTIDDLPAGFDPESPQVNNGYYPQQRTLMGGLTITF